MPINGASINTLAPKKRQISSKIDTQITSTPETT